MEVRRRAVAAVAAVAGLLVALLAGFAPALTASSASAAPSTVRPATGATVRLAVQQPGAVLTHQVRAEREAGAGPGIPAACPPPTGVAAPARVGAVTVPALRTDAPWRAVRCADGRAPPAAALLAVPLSLG